MFTLGLNYPDKRQYKNDVLPTPSKYIIIVVCYFLPSPRTKIFIMYVILLF